MPSSPYKNYLLSASVVLSLLLSGCAKTGLAVINARAKLLSDLTVTTDIQYGLQQWQYLDLYVPTLKPKHTRYPVLVFFYGGSWDTGNKKDYYFAAAAFAKLGYLVVIPDYVKYPQGKFPTFIKDGARSLAWVKNNISRYAGDDNNIFVVGHSAGAHLGALLLADSHYLDEVNLKANDIRAFAGLAGPYAFVPTAPRFTRVFEPPSNYPKMNVSNYINGDEPPMLLAHGSEDTVVKVDNKNSVIRAIRSFDGIYKDVNYPNVSHIQILLGITSPLLGQANPSIDIDQFFRQFIQHQSAN